MMVVLTHHTPATTSPPPIISHTCIREAFPPCPCEGVLASASITCCLLATFSSLLMRACIEDLSASFRILCKLGTLVSRGAGGGASIVDYGTDHAIGNS